MTHDVGDVHSRLHLADSLVCA